VLCRDGDVTMPEWLALHAESQPLAGRPARHNPRWNLALAVHPENGLLKGVSGDVGRRDTLREKNFLASEHSSTARRTWFDRPIAVTANQILEVLEQRDPARSPCTPVTISRIIRAIFL
jgi:hypothetical protein